MVLDDIADVRAGDKGDTLILAVRPRDPTDFHLLRERLTSPRVAAHFGPQVRGEVTRRELPLIPALVLRVPGILAGGVTGNATLDGHGKSLSYHLLMLDL